MLDIKLLLDKFVVIRAWDFDGNVVQWLKIKIIHYLKGEKKQYSSIMMLKISLATK